MPPAVPDDPPSHATSRPVPLDGVVRDQGRALGNPTRIAILDRLRRAADPVSVADLCDQLGLNHNGIRRHLRLLRDSGLVVEERLAPQGPGRPALVYRPAPGAVERWDGVGPQRELSAMLLGMLISGRSAREVGRDAGQRLTPPSVADPLTALEWVTRELGFDPQRITVTGEFGAEILLNRCPFVDGAQLAPEIVCQLHLGIAEGVTIATGGRIAISAIVIADPLTGGCRIQVEVPDPPDEPR